MHRYIVLRDTQDRDGRRQLSACLQGDGTLLIEGHDMGPGVARCLGPDITEYEWAISIPPSGVEQLKLALSCRDDILAALQDRFSGEASGELQGFLDQHAGPYDFWSRAGE